ncbi:MAG: hypothetical protein O9346_17375 [Leptospiraceae bacterium]|jgi:hypothetical protein|nr:hypothetical protein [Leptospiraceae bacterium]
MKEFKISSTSFEKPSEIKISPELEDVQRLMPMSEEDYQRLKESIQSYGKLREHLKGYQDKTGTFFLLSGWNRLKIASELEFKTIPCDIVEGLETPEERKQYAISENLDRRQLTTEQKRELVKFFLRLNPENSDREISKKVGVSHPTVSKIREDEISRGKIYHVDKKDSLGRKVGKKISRGEIPHVEKQTSKTSQNQNREVSKSSPTQTKQDRIKALKMEKKRLEKELDKVEKELKKLEAKK